MNQFVAVDTNFDIPPGESLERVSTCVVPRDIQIVKLLGHLHEWGTYFSLERLDEQGNPTAMLYEKDWEPSYTSNPPVASYPKDEPLTLTAGTRLRQTCRWQNTEDYNLVFPREMCVSFGFYYPDHGELFCDME